MTESLIIVQIVLVIILVIAVLLQKSSSIGLGAYSGSNESVFGAKGPNSFLAKVTFTIGFLFVANTIALGYMYSKAAESSVTDTMTEETNILAPEVKIQTIPEIETEVVPEVTTQEIPEVQTQVVPEVATQETPAENEQVENEQGK